MDLQLNMGKRDIVWQKDPETGFMIPGLYWDAQYNSNQEARIAAQVVILNKLNRQQKNQLFKGESIKITEKGVDASGNEKTYKVEINSDNFIEGMGMFLSVDEYGYAEDFFGSASFGGDRLRDEIINKYQLEGAGKDKTERKKLKKQRNKDLRRLDLIESAYVSKMFPDSPAVVWNNQEYNYKQFEKSRKAYNRAFFKGYYGTIIIPPQVNFLSGMWKKWRTLRKLGEFNVNDKLTIVEIEAGKIKLINKTNYKMPYWVPDRGWVELDYEDFIVIDFTAKKGNVVGHAYNRAEKLKKYNSEKLGYAEGHLGSVQMVRDERTDKAQENQDAARHNRKNKVKSVGGKLNIVFNPKKALRVFIYGNIRVEERSGGRVALINQNDFDRARYLIESKTIEENNQGEMQKFVDALGPDTKDRDVMEKYIKFKDEKQSQKLYSFKKTLLAGNEAKDQEIWVSATFMSRVSSIEIRNPNSDEDSVFVDRKDASELILKVKNKDKNDVSYIPANAVKNGNKVDAVSQGNPKVSYEIDFKKPWYRRKANLTLQAIEFENSVNDEDNWVRDWQAQRAKEAKVEDARTEAASLNSSNGKLGYRILSAVMAKAKNGGDSSLLKASQVALKEMKEENLKEN